MDVIHERGCVYSIQYHTVDGINKICYNINRWDDGDSLVNISAVVGSSQESCDFSRE